jgi:uncharacterized protein YdaL
MVSSIVLAVSLGTVAPQFLKRVPKASVQTTISIRNSGLTSLIVYDEPDGEQSERMTARYIANLLGHFGIKPEIVSALEYSAGQSSRFSSTFILGSALRGPLPKILIHDVAASDRPVCWLNRNIEQFLAEPGITDRLGFRFKKHTELDGDVSVVFKGRSLPKKEGLINLVSIQDPSKAKVLAVARNKGMSTPYAIRSGNFWYFADLVFSYTVEADRSLVFGDLLHDILGQQHNTERKALVRIEDVNPESRPEQLRKIADVMTSKGIPFQISLIPIYKNTTRRVEIYLSDRPQVVEALKYMVSRGGSIILHGVTHQLRGDSGDDFEFWDALTDRPPQDSTDTALVQKLELGMDECFRAGLFPIAWETPHYAASVSHYQALQPFFSHAYDRRNVSDDRRTQQEFPYEIEDIFGQRIIPENLGYVSLEKPDPDAIVNAAGRMLCVRDSIPSFFFHPFMSTSYLKTILDGIERHGYRFISARDFGCSVSVGNYAVSTVPKTVSIAATQPFSRRVTIDGQGQTSELYQKAARGKTVEENLVPPPGGLIAVQSVLRVPGPKRKPPLYERILAWWNDIDIESIPVPQQVARKALLVVDASKQAVPDAVGIRSFESFLGVYGIRFERVEAVHLERQKLGEDSVVFVPRSVAGSLTKSGKDKLAKWLHDGGRLVLEGRSSLAEDLGFVYETRKLSLVSIKDALYPGVAIKWNRAAEMEKYDPPPVSTTLIEDEESGRPVAVASRHGNGLVIYIGTDLDPETGMGYTRYPYLFHHLRSRMRLNSPVTAYGVEFYFDPGYREEAPLEKLVSSWHADGIRAVYAAAWHVYPKWQYKYDTLIRLCHERGIAVYAWFELPQVSDLIWTAHPEWREKTVTGKDGQVGWRKQMNLANRDCRKAALAYFEGLLNDYDWDGVNIAELAFDTRDGLLDPNGYVPMNGDVRAEFKKRGGFDPILLFDTKSPFYWQKNKRTLEKWERYRTQLLNGWLVEVLDRVEKVRKKRSLDCIVTAFDSLHTPRIVEKTGTDTRNVVALMDRYDFTLQIEDPVELWGDMPNRYGRFAETYKKLVKDPQRLMFDINVVTDRESRLAPTKLPAGTELALTAFSAAQSGNGRVAIYSEASLQPEDRSLLPFVLGSAAGLSLKQIMTSEYNSEGMRAAASDDGSIRIAAGRTVRLSLVNESGKDTLYLGPAGDTSHAGYRMVREQGSMLMLNNEPWQCGREGEVLIPVGEHTLGNAKMERGLVDRFGLGLWMKDVTAEVERVSRTPLGIAIEYTSPRRAWAVLTREPNGVYVDGRKMEAPPVDRYGSEYLVQIPSGRHKVEINDETTASVVIDMASAVSSRSVVWLGGKFVLILVILYAAVRARRLILVLWTKLK